MQTITLGKTGIEVSELCFGALPIGPIQKNVDVESAGDTIAHSLENGVTFVDTAQMYQTYPHLKLAMEKSGKRPVISSKSAASEYEPMKQAVESAIESLGVDYIDIFFLHAARADRQIFDERKGALDALLDCKAKGLIKAAGVSTHNVQVTRLAAKNDAIDVVFPIINVSGKGILGGTREEMAEAIEECFAVDKGVMLMKALAGGALIPDYVRAMDYITDFSKKRAAIAVGMVNMQEVDMNLRYFNGADVKEYITDLKDSGKKFYIVSGLCKKCGACQKNCHSDAIFSNGELMEIDEKKCLTCGYCVEACKEFAIRMI